MSLAPMTPAEFQECGLLAEVNRQILHPLGLALSVVMDEDGVKRLGPIYRAVDRDNPDRMDPEGYVFDPVDLDLLVKAERVARMQNERWPLREAALGFIVQPLDVTDER